MRFSGIKQLAVFSFFILGVNAIAQNYQPYTSSEIYEMIKKLPVAASVLYIAAHPDDENNTLLPYLAKEKMYRTAYLSLTRGDGGQNLIGAEQGVELGLIRTQELLAARKIDGAEQYFSTAYEFGYSKTLDETLKIWDKQKVLRDIVWVIRKFKPDVIITRFPPDARAGHGHHSASALLANEAFFAAADPSKFPEQLQNGISPWQAKRIVWNTFNFGSTNTTNNSQLKIDISGFNNLLGKSYGEIGAEARSMHKSQGEGRARRRGNLVEYFSHTHGDSAKTDLLDGVNKTYEKFLSNELATSLTNKIRSTIATYNFENPENSLPALISIYKELNTAEKSSWQQIKLSELKKIILACSGVLVESFTTQDYGVQGDSVKINFNVLKRKNNPVLLNKIEVDDFSILPNTTLSLNIAYSAFKTLLINKPISQPYWLKQPQTDGMFSVDDYAVIGEAENKPAYTTTFTITIENETFTIDCPVEYKLVNQVRGELYQPFYIYPSILVKEKNSVQLLKPKQPINNSILYTALTKTQKIEILKNNQPFFNTTKTSLQNQQQEFSSQTTASNSIKKVWIDSFTFSNNTPTQYAVNINYNHIPNLVYFKQALQKNIVSNLKIIGKKVGYINGAGDKVAEILEQMGYNVDVIEDKDITLQNLKKYQAIVTGIRAYNIHEWMTNKSAILNDYIAQGGNLIVQYIRSLTVNNKKAIVGPYTFNVNASSRVSEEDALITLNEPQNLIFNYPNKIEASDFDNWIQERSTYQAEKMDSIFTTPIIMNDANEKPSNGSLAIAPYGKGNFVYCSLAMFRQLPEGVIGAIKLMANLIALPKN
jgi:LmbE family N-acetylglucosaminyl deacetylase